MPTCMCGPQIGMRPLLTALLRVFDSRDVHKWDRKNYHDNK